MKRTWYRELLRRRLFIIFLLVLQIHMTTRSYYRELLYGGGKIYGYSKGFIHSKIFVFGDHTATVGTANM